MTGRLAPQAWRRVAPALFAVAWGGNEFTPLLVLYKRTDGFGTATVDILLGAYVLGIVPALLLGGPLSDRYGRRPLLLPAPLLGILGSLTLAVGHGSLTLLLVGRLLSGVSLGLAMAVGTSWVQELSRTPFDPDADAGAGARRASTSLTLGFTLGAAVAAALAQWGPAPTVTPYVVHVLVSVVPAVVLWGAPESRPRAALPGSLRDDLRIPSAGSRRFWLLVFPMAPWVFGCAASAYAILPTVTTDLAASWDVAYAGLLCLVGLGCGTVVQLTSRRIVARSAVRAVVVGLGLVVVGMAVAACGVAWPSLWLTVPAAAVLGCAYGLLMVAGLTQVQRIAGPDDLAGLTAVYYGLCYLGFFAPAVLAGLSTQVPYVVLLGAGSVVAVACLAVVLAGERATGNR
ncbi:MFS transporter [Luteimicrobium subarcticum]|uniref:Putative MFS family arabinose efflux permease n=1 Tax=Luteimicrobium subarcticum TaxID=620910 RepID=A0A2M8WQW9_9MICO|nr:MFS transporter [Luteimicrobium subarcticum]PJI93323.1 putative MFS family arabinose efflux permease [Luteimicrobium subarcticum]